MQIFRDVNIDWVGKMKYFLAGSVVLLLIAGTAWYQDGGLRYGIDFRGGTLVYVRFAQAPPVDQIRQALGAEGLGKSEIQRIGDARGQAMNEVVIGLDQQGSEEEALDAGKTAILNALNKRFGKNEPGKQDLNAASAATVAELLTRRNPLGLGPAAGDQYTQLARGIIAYRDAEKSGLITDLNDLKNAEGVNDAVVAALGESFYLGEFAVRNVEIVGPRVGEQLRRQAVLATLYALAGMLVYIAFRFEWVYGAAAVLAVAHDVLITLGFFSVFDFEISLTVIAALLTLVGYSMNDTIVIFDRVRENLRLMRREPLAVIINRSINQTLSRTVMTSGLTFLTVLVLFLIGGEVLRAFAFALVVGVLVGTYSSIGIAAALVVAWSNWRGTHALVGATAAAGRASRADNAERVAAAGRR